MVKEKMVDQKTREPYLNIWFGNFYRPAYDDRQFVKESIALLKKLGFNSVLLDTKAWEDFKEHCEGKEASPYVAMQEYMRQELREAGMSHEFLALYLNGDNLYPNIRFSPPIYGESITDKNGNDGKWYRYWSGKARASMAEHVDRIMKTYGENYVTILLNGQERKPICSMWDPIAAPSFDAEGRQRYLSWLSEQYEGDITLFNQAYGVSKKSFEELQKEDYWFACRYPSGGSVSDEGRLTAPDSIQGHPEAPAPDEGRLTAPDSVQNHPESPAPDEDRGMPFGCFFTEEDIKTRSPRARMLMDNRKWQCDELCLYFEDMEKRLHQIDESLYLCPDMAQWGYFLNVDGAMLEGVGFADLWDTAARGIDIYRLAKYVDCANFISVPVTPAGDPDIYVTACHHSMLRNINHGREFVGGIYWGRFLYNDLYAVITPCETVASIVASGASGYTSYGMCGLDDGGVLHRMGPEFQESLSRANAWAKQVIPALGEKKQAQTAILFPSAMAAYETMRTEGNQERRLDLLGWYKACRDLGVEADVTDARGLLENHRFDNYRVLIIPDDDCYAMNPDPEFEAALKAWCERGGTLLYGPDCGAALGCFGAEAVPHSPDAFFYQEKGMVKGRSFCSYAGGKSIACYLSDQAPCVTKYENGKGCRYAFGFSYGYAYDTKFVPHVPAEQKNNELYPLEMMKGNLLADILKEAGIETKQEKGIERAAFSNGEILINHTSYPFEVSEDGEKLFQYPVNGSLLLPHSALFVKYKK